MARHNHRLLERHLIELRPDVVGWWSMGGLSLTLLEAVRRQGLPAVAFVHDEGLDYGRWPSVDGWLGLFAGRRARLAPIAERLAGIPATVGFADAATYMFVSDFVRRHALGLGLGLRSTGVAHSGIHPAFLEPAPKADWGWRLLYVGRIDPRKGVDAAVKALAHLPSEARLEIAGGWDAVEEERLRDLASGIGVAEKVDFTGQLQRSGIATAYERADAVVFPVRWEEPWGLVPLEAMGKGRPVVATGRGGSAEYLRDGENCLLFEADDVGALVGSLERLASDPGLRCHLRACGTETAAKYTEPMFNEAVERALVEAVDRQGRHEKVPTPV
jgi:glycosyltransferase involved in cell wall biosynthesis